MNQILLGKTNQKVSSVSLGTWSYGGANVSGEMPVGWANQTDEDSRQALQTAYESGINHWDTADVYGNGKSEQIIGSMWEYVPRNEIFLRQKLGGTRDNIETGITQNTCDFKWNPHWKD